MKFTEEKSEKAFVESPENENKGWNTYLCSCLQLQR